MTTEPAGPLFLLAHGAGKGSSSEWMQGWAARLETLGAVVSFDYPYVRAGRRSPDKLPKLIEAHREALAEARAAHPDRDRVVLAGKSLGSRVGCHLSLEEPVAGLVCLGYPLKGINGKVRSDVLEQLQTPVLFLQGTRDRLCPLDLLEEVRPRIPARNELHTVEEGDHSLTVTKRWQKATGRTQADADAATLRAIAAFLDATGPAGGDARP